MKYRESLGPKQLRKNKFDPVRDKENCSAALKCVRFTCTRANMDTHATILESVCRVGGRRFDKCSHTTRYSVETYSDQLKSVFNIDTSEDKSDTHPKHICSLCERVIARCTSGSMQCGGGCGDPFCCWQLRPI